MKTYFNDLWIEVNRMKLDSISKMDILVFEDEGLDTKLDDIYPSDAKELFTVLKDGSVHKTLVYISERPKYYDDRGWDYPKFHLFDCQTMTSMRSQNRGDRYRKAAKLNGNFGINIVQVDGKKKHIEKNLDVCGYCLRFYNEHYQDNKIKSTFKIKEYLHQPMVQWKPLISEEEDMTVIPRFYARNWKQISDSMKKERNYTCQECHTRLDGDMKRYLHTHHMDANPGNNDQGNLKVVCISCHAEEFNHGHIRSTPDYIRFEEIMNGAVA
ncbi:MAG: hypothetical protein DRG78_22080 [Epsilonproteobacteria bacterium]|nr:MAG: hypothetical protein DRG78_22080 [Campylobacterota bacterium]